MCAPFQVECEECVSQTVSVGGKAMWRPEVNLIQINHNLSSYSISNEYSIFYFQTFFVRFYNIFSKYCQVCTDFTICDFTMLIAGKLDLRPDQTRPDPSLAANNDQSNNHHQWTPGPTVTVWCGVVWAVCV